MSLNIIGIGGTGHRILKAVIHLAAIGAFGKSTPALELNVLTVDSDGGNADFKNLQDAIDAYKNYQGVLGGFPKIETPKDKINWSPFSEQEAQPSLATYIKAGKFSDENKFGEIIDFLYTKDEQEMVLANGFYGHPSIGSYIVNGELDDADDESAWKRFVNNLDEVEDCVFIIGSIYGGTGASGIPVITQKMRKLKPEIKMATLLSLPYFMPVGNTKNANDRISPETSYFIPKTMGALYYYDQQGYAKNIGTSVNSLYIVGERDSSYWEKEQYSVGGGSQEHKAHISELFAALSCVDFYRRFKNLRNNANVDIIENESVYIPRRIMDDSERYPYTWEMLEMQDKQLKEQLMIFMMTAILFTKLYYHELGVEGKASNVKIQKFQVTNEEKKKLYGYMLNFCNWMKELHTQNMKEGDTITNKPEENILVEFFKIYDKGNMYDLIDGSRDERKPYELNNFETLIKNKSEKKGFGGGIKVESKKIPSSRKILDEIPRQMPEKDLSVFIEHINNICKTTLQREGLI